MMTKLHCPTSVTKRHGKNALLWLVNRLSFSKLNHIDFILFTCLVSSSLYNCFAQNFRLKLAILFHCVILVHI